MDNATRINSAGLFITTQKSDSVRGMSFLNNKKIEFLPENIADKFSNLTTLSAMNCSVKAISGKNFRGLDKLVLLNLAGNLITMVQSDTFEGLSSLTGLFLGEIL